MKKIFIVVLLSTIMYSCGNFDLSIFKNKDNSEEIENEERLFWLVVLLSKNRKERATALLNRANKGLNEWDINLENNLIEYGRNVSNPSFKFNPSNWISVSDENCNAIGIPQIIKDNCPFTPPSSAIGFCYKRANSLGKIYDSTLIMLDTFQNSEVYSEEFKQIVFTHEVGHCLGLKHTPEINNIMYPSVDGTSNSPSIGELSAIQDVYGTSPTVEPSIAIKDLYYDETNSLGFAHRHLYLPKFYISATIGNEFVVEEPKVLGDFIIETIYGQVNTIELKDGKIICEEHK